MENGQPIAILNGAIITADGEYSCRTISLEEFKKLIQSASKLFLQ